MEDLLKKLLPNGTFATIGKVFDLVAIAETQIERAIEKHPAKRKELREAFTKYLFPGELARFSDRVYRAHVCEVLDRIVKDHDPKQGTMAECLVSLSLASLKAPLNARHLVAMQKAFAFVFPEQAEEDTSRSAYNDEAEEILAELRRKIARSRQ